jgi:hypothetical protein
LDATHAHATHATVLRQDDPVFAAISGRWGGQITAVGRFAPSARAAVDRLLDLAEAGSTSIRLVSRSHGSRIDAQRAADRYSVHHTSKKDKHIESR